MAFFLGSSYALCYENCVSNVIKPNLMCLITLPEMMSRRNGKNEKFQNRRNGSRQNGSKRIGTNHRRNRNRRNGSDSLKRHWMSTSRYCSRTGKNLMKGRLFYFLPNVKMFFFFFFVKMLKGKTKLTCYSIKWMSKVKFYTTAVEKMQIYQV